MKQSLALAISVLSAAAVADEYLDPKGLGFDPFVPFGAIPQSELYPKAAKFSVSKEGHLLVNGQPHYFPATIWYGATELECNEDTPGYVPELKWLYQEMPGYDNLQRLGRARRHRLRGADGVDAENEPKTAHAQTRRQEVRGGDREHSSRLRGLHGGELGPRVPFVRREGARAWRTSFHAVFHPD